ncbi:glutathione S-transferase [Cobetia amphilecti]|uniref:glutathione transferase n=1 Tax=Cobetia amphilecti TaxID=1055104 RepID=A0AAP4TZV6_9GAMM|nr:glutathione S-transferase [Cobetia amphilecti]MDO6672824.1 glutathione S-transferase [Cobetia amphilecti]
MITVHHLENSRSQRILWLLEELNLEYRLQTYARDSNSMRAPKALKEIHPLGKAPIITDTTLAGENAEPVVVAESGAIIEYLIDLYAGQGSGSTAHLRPLAGSQAERDYRFWLHFAEGSAMLPLMLRLVFSRLDKPPVPWLVRPIARKLAKGVNDSFISPEIKAHLAYMDTCLEHRQWLAGDSLTGADIQMSFPIQALDARQGLKNHPNIQEWLARIRQREAFQRAVAKGGELAL